MINYFIKFYSSYLFLPHVKKSQHGCMRLTPWPQITHLITPSSNPLPSRNEFNIRIIWQTLPVILDLSPSLCRIWLPYLSTFILLGYSSQMQKNHNMVAWGGYREQRGKDPLPNNTTRTNLRLNSPDHTTDSPHPPRAPPPPRASPPSNPPQPSNNHLTTSPFASTHPTLR